MLTVVIYCKNINRTKPISKLSLPPYLLTVVYLSLQSIALIMVEIGIDGDYGKLDTDTGEVDWDDHR